MADYEIIPAVAGQKNKASTYNENFTRMKNYVDTSVEESADYVQEQLTTYSDVNTLATSGEVALSDNSVNTITPAGAVTFTLPTISGDDASKYHQILVQIKLDDLTYITAEDDGLGTDYFFNGEAPDFGIIGYYDLIYVYDNIRATWCAGAIYKGVAE